MASPAPRMRPRRASRSSLSRDYAYGDEAEEELQEERAPRRRAGKEPVEEDEEYEPASEEDAEQAGGRQQGGRLAGSRRMHEGEQGAGPSQKRGRRTGGANVKAEPRGDEPGPSRRPAAAVAAAGAGGGGARPAALTAGQLKEVEDKIAEYRRLRDYAKEKAAGKAPVTAMEAASRTVARHMLFAHSEKPGVPVKRTAAELVTLVTPKFPNLKHKGPVTAYVIAHAQHYLAEGMGLEMRAMGKRSVQAVREAALTGAAEEGSQEFVLRSLVPAPLRAAFVLDPMQHAERGLLMVVLALIQMAGGKLAEEELCTQLGELGVSKDHAHPLFQPLPLMLKTFCTRRYIQQEKQQGPDGETVTYHFAEQADGPDAEIGKDQITRFIEEQFAGDAQQQQ